MDLDIKFQIVYRLSFGYLLPAVFVRIPLASSYHGTTSAGRQNNDPPSKMKKNKLLFFLLESAAMNSVNDILL